MTGLEQLNGLDEALNQGWKIEGCCSDYPYFPGLYTVVLLKNNLGEINKKIGIGTSVEQAIYEAAQILHCGYRVPQLEFTQSTGRQYNGDLDCWIGRDGSFECIKEELVTVSIFGSGHEHYYDAMGNCFLDALDRAFPGEKRILQKYLENPPVKRAVIPFSVPYLVNPNVIVREGLLNQDDGCNSTF